MFIFPQELQEALDGVPSLVNIKPKQIKYVLKVKKKSYINIYEMQEAMSVMVFVKWYTNYDIWYRIIIDYFIGWLIKYFIST